MDKVLIIIAYALIVAIVVNRIIRQVGQNRMLELEFDGFYFLKYAVGCAICSQVGFIILVSVLYHAQHSVAVGLTALIGIPGWLIVTLTVMRGFTVRYNSIANLIKRLDRMNPLEQEALLSSLPPEIFSKLPGDYRFVNHSNSSAKF